MENSLRLLRAKSSITEYPVTLKVYEQMTFGIAAQFLSAIYRVQLELCRALHRIVLGSFFHISRQNVLGHFVPFSYTPARRDPISIGSQS